MKHEILMNEALDQGYEVKRVTPKVSYVFDEWEFEVGGQTHVVRFTAAPYFGKKVANVDFGVRNGAKVRRKIESLPNIRKYLATVLDVTKMAIDNPTEKMKTRTDGMVLLVPEKVYAKVGSRFTRLAKLLLKTTSSVSDAITKPPEGEQSGMNTIFVWKKGRSFKGVFSGVADQLENDIVEPEHQTSKPVQVSSVKVFPSQSAAEKAFTKEMKPLFDEIFSVSSATSGSMYITAEKSAKNSFGPKLNLSFTQDNKGQALIPFENHFRNDFMKIVKKYVSNPVEIEFITYGNDDVFSGVTLDFDKIGNLTVEMIPDSDPEDYKPGEYFKTLYSSFKAPKKPKTEKRKITIENVEAALVDFFRDGGVRRSDIQIIPKEELYGQNILGVAGRYWGNWQIPDGEDDGDGDYDWEELTPESRKKLKDAIDRFNKNYSDYVFTYGVSEKNWIDISVREA